MSTEHAVPEAQPRRRRRSMPLLDHVWRSLGAPQEHGIAPFGLAIMTLGPAALVATSLEYWLELPGSILLVGLLMACFGVYLAAVTPLLVDGEAAARRRSLAASIDHADASMRTLLAAGAATGVLVGAGLELRLLPGFLILGLLALTLPAAVRERRGALAALRRGFSLTQGNALAFAALGALIGAAALGLYGSLAFVLDPLPGFLGEFLAVTTTATLAAPVAAHAFVRAFDGRADGRRLIIRPAPDSAASTAASAMGRAALARTRGAFAEHRPRAPQHVSFTARPHPSAAQLRYSPDVASQTLRAGTVRDEPAAMPGWAHTVDEATVEELHSAV